MRKFLLPILLLIVVLQTVFLFIRLPHLQGFISPDYWKEWWRVGHIMRLVQTSYVDEEEAPFSLLAEKAIRGMIEGLDPHSTYLDTDGFESFETQRHQTYAGIGVEVREIEEGLLVTTVFPDSPAQKAMIAPGDRIIEVDGASIEGEQIGDVVARIRGEKGSAVDLVIYRQVADRTFDVRIHREQITFPTVEWKGEVAEGIHLVRIRQFGSRTPEELADTLQTLSEGEFRGIIFDLRNNPGGLLNSTIEALDLFVEPGQILVSTESARAASTHSFKAKHPPLMTGVPILVLQNRFSASAAEIFAGTLQSHGLAKIIGEDSLGKGSVQSVIPLQRGDAVSLTTLRYLLPDGQSVEDSGIVPDYKIELEEETVIRLAVQAAYVDWMDPEEFEESFGFPPIEDKVLERAIELLREEESNRSAAGR